MINSKKIFSTVSMMAILAATPAFADDYVGAKTDFENTPSVEKQIEIDRTESQSDINIVTKQDIKEGWKDTKQATKDAAREVKQGVKDALDDGKCHVRLTRTGLRAPVRILFRPQEFHSTHRARIALSS